MNNLQSEEGHTLLLRLVGPMQSWGFRSRFDNRDTALEPTRSGVIGLLCAALGISRDEPERLAPLSALKMGVRVDAPGRVLVDYHTAQRVARADGGIAGTMQSWRYYLSDARFLVGLESGDVHFLASLEAALRDPVWPLCLGRKSFVPSLPIHLAPSGLRQASLKNALREEPWRRVHQDERTPQFLPLHLESSEPGNGPAMGDVPLDFKNRRFGLRHLSLGEARGFSIEKEALCFFPN